MDSSDIEQFARLFEGRSDARGAVHGESLKGGWGFNEWSAHLLQTGHSLGVYPMGDNGMVHWGCTDIDKGYEESWPMAQNIQTALLAMGIHSMIERTKSKGFHIWVFMADDEWIHGSHMRQALLVAHQLAGVAPTEVNPKNPDPTKIVWGNYVNLPYAADYAPLGKRVMVDEAGEPLTLDEFMEASEVKRNDPAAIHSASALWVPPPPPKTVAISDYDGSLSSITGRMNGLTFTIFKDGPLEGRDRSTTMARLMYLMAEQGFPAGEALAALEDFDDRFGKFVGRYDREAQLRKIVERAYSK